MLENSPPPESHKTPTRWNNLYVNCLLDGKIPQWVEDSERYKPANARNFLSD